MSFPHITDNHVINFREEKDYLNCRSQYLQRLCLAPSFDPSFLDFVTGEMYSEGSCVIENITPIPESSSVGNDSAYYNNPVIDTSTMGSPSGYVYNSDNNQIHMVAQSGVVPPNHYPIHTDNIASELWNTTIPISYGDPQTYTVAVGVDFVYNNDGEISDVKVEGKKEKKEEPPDDPIENRWQILDL